MLAHVCMVCMTEVKLTSDGGMSMRCDYEHVVPEKSLNLTHYPYHS
jgi:hypothetical protein